MGNCYFVMDIGRDDISALTGKGGKSDETDDK